MFQLLDELEGKLLSGLGEVGRPLLDGSDVLAHLFFEAVEGLDVVVNSLSESVDYETHLN